LATQTETLGKGLCLTEIQESLRAIKIKIFNDQDKECLMLDGLTFLPKGHDATLPTTDLAPILVPLREEQDRIEIA
jgi:hypothetical protein